MAESNATALTELGDGVWAWLQPGGETGVSNAGVIADDDGLTIVDTLMVPSQWGPFIAAVAELDQVVKRVVLTHAHVDHVGGTVGFRNAAVYGTPITSDLLDGEMPVDAYKAFMPAFADEFDELAETGTRPVSHLVDGAANLTPRAEVLPASGHTPGDLMVLVADADVLFAGDLCFFGVTPLAFQGDPALWATMLDAVAELADTIVPGHGPVGGEKEVRELQTYLRHCVAANGDAAAIPPGPWDQWLDRDPRDRINVERAALLAQGRDEIPPAMVEAIGLG
jgi:cyclase